MKKTQKTEILRGLLDELATITTINNELPKHYKNSIEPYINALLDKVEYYYNIEVNKQRIPTQRIKKLKKRQKCKM